jgi:hypothetical protein
MGWLMSISAKLPSVCKCGCHDGTITAGNAVVCTACGATRVNISPMTQSVLAGIAQHFGELKEPVVFRRSSAIAQITKQDEFLQRKSTPDGKSWFDVITEHLGKEDDEFIPIADPENEAEQ